MDLPQSVSAVAAVLADGGQPEPAPELFHDRDVFAAEFARVFLRPWLAADHVSRLAEDGRYFLVEAAARSLMITRESATSFHALRNTCIHAGYPVCEDEEGEADRLLCPYHGWRYAIDGRLLEPRLSAEQETSPRYRLTSYPVHVAAGLFFLDPSGTAEGSPPVAALPEWLEGASVSKRRRFETSWNWKHLRHYLWSAPELFSACAVDAVVELGPLCRLLASDEEAVLLQLIPRSAERSDFRMVQIAAAPNAARGLAEDRIAAGLAQAGERIAAGPLAFLDRDFFLWYAGLMS
ncbi:MAG TPA: Rieske 2Fe-2S domain-containing protein [Stellaceae bacterium]|nr:Rieske 2Fe-2S domain-containing protein [Stellaceae bacterium]